MEKYNIELINNTNDSLVGKSIKFGFNKESNNMYSWTIISENKDSILLWSDYILKDIVFYDKLNQEDYNMYKNSCIKEYLDNEFIKNFTVSELDLIESLGKDKFYILSEDDLIRYFSIDYNKENKFLCAKPDSLLFSKSFETNESGYGKYWLKNFDSKHDYAKIIDSFGHITRAKINNQNIGIRVALWLKKNKTYNLLEKK